MKKYLMFLVLFVSFAFSFFWLDNIKAHEVFNETYSYNGATLNVTYDTETKHLTFTSSRTGSNNYGIPYSGYITITKDYYLFIYDNVSQRFYVQQSDYNPLYLMTFNTRTDILSMTNQRLDYTGMDATWYTFNNNTYDGIRTGNVAWTSPWFTERGLDFGKTGSQTFNTWVNSGAIHGTINVNNSSGNTLFEANIDETPPISSNITNFGDGRSGVSVPQITIYSDTSPNVECPTNTDFVNDFCYINKYNYETNDDILNDYLIADFYVKSSNGQLRFKSGDYYILTFRVDNSFNLKPVAFSVTSGTTSRNVNFVKYNIKNYSLYKDYQVVITPIQNDIDLSLDNLSIIFDNNSNYNINVNDYSVGLYKNIRYSGVGNTEPDSYIMDKDYESFDLSNMSDTSYNGSFFNNFNVNTHGFSSIITAPLRIIRAFTTYSNSCSPLTFTFPHSNQTFTLPCLQSVLSDNLGSLFTLLQFLLSGIVCYRVALGYFETIKHLNDPVKDTLEVVDL